MIGVEEAQARILALGRPVGVETVSLSEAAGRWCAHEVAAHRTQPYSDLSSMDGYAVRSSDGNGPWTVVGESAAGSPFAQPIGPGEAVRVFTGAALPPGADAVVIQEDVERDGTSVTARDAQVVSKGWVRRAGSDFAAGHVLLRAGDPLTPAAIALAAAGGHGDLAVRRKVRIALISTGDELVPPGADAQEGRLPASNGVMLTAMLRTSPVDVVDLGVVPDDLDHLARAFGRASECDLIVTSGGASVGDHDLVRPALQAGGGMIDFWRVAMRPGKPLMAGLLGDAVVLGLPGNPVSAFVTAMLFLLPLVRHLSGARDPLPRHIVAELAAPMPQVGPRTDFVRARWVEGLLEPLPSSDSAMLVPLATADALIVRPAHSLPCSLGARVDAILLT